MTTLQQGMNMPLILVMVPQQVTASWQEGAVQKGTAAESWRGGNDRSRPAIAVPDQWLHGPHICPISPERRAFWACGENKGPIDRNEICAAKTWSGRKRNEPPPPPSVVYLALRECPRSALCGYL